MLAGPRWVVADANFSPEEVERAAAALAGQSYEPPGQVPEGLSNLDYNTYRQIRFRKSQAIWAQNPSRFTLELFAPGYLYKEGVDLFLVEDGVAAALVANADTFETPSAHIAQLLDEVRRFAGFRVHYPLNRADYQDEFLVFLGASYFRAVSKGQRYGLSARGLAIDVAEPTGEEFPTFRRFWIERPQKGASHIVIHALLDSPSVAGAYHFTVRAGDPTSMDIEATLYPREALNHIGIGTLTSMFMHGPMDMEARPDYRPAVHDSHALAMHNSRGEHIWRPLSNPGTLQVSAFVDENPHGFGLVQRQRQFDAYQDLDDHYELRPSAWVTPLSEWGRGHVVLVEIPSDSKDNDNIIAYWRPAQPLEAGKSYKFAWQISLPEDCPLPETLARVTRSAYGLASGAPHRQVMIDYAPLAGVDPDKVKLEVECQPGEIIRANARPNRITGGLRVAVRFDTQDHPASEIRVQPKYDERPVGETWLYRWTRG